MTIDEQRTIIDGIDEDLVRLLNARATCAAEIGRIKRDEGARIVDPEREREVLEHVRQVNSGPLGDDVLTDIFDLIIRRCCDIQE